MWMISDLLKTLAAQGDRPAIVQIQGEAARSVTAAEAAGQAMALAYGLVAVGIRPGEPVALVGPNSADWVIVRLAIAAAGGLAVACDEQSNQDEIAAIISHSGCRLAFVSLLHAAWMAERDVLKGLDLRLLEGDDERGWRRMTAAPPGPLPQLKPEAEALVVYTSGTTGTPKSFTLTHANMAANIDALLAENIVGSGDHVLLPLPLHHVYPLLVGMLTTLASGACLVFPEAITGPQIATALRVGKATVMVGVPRLYAALLAGIEGRVAARGKLAAMAFRTLLTLSIGARRRFGWRLGRRLFGQLHRQLGGHLRLMASGGAKLEGPIIWRLEGLGWQTLSGYGLAETASMFTANLPGRQKVGSEGRPIGQGQIRIAPVEGLGLEKGEGTVVTGEIQLKGQSVFAGYRDNPEANATAFTEDGWFRTGDLGHLDADGYVYVTGRAKEMLVLGGGKNIYPEEVERHYAANPHIRELAVLEREGKLVALVLPDMAALRAAGLTRADDAIRIALAEGSQGLPSYQRIAGFALAREPLPRTRLGKYRRFLLPDLYDAARRGLAPAQAGEMSQADKTLVAVSPAREAWAYLKARYADRGIEMDSNLALDLGVDSLEWMTVALELESRLAVRISEAMLQEVETVRDLLAEVAKAEPVTAATVPSTAAVAAEADRWLAPTGALLSAAGVFLYGLNWLLMHGLFGLRTAGEENVPKSGRVLIVANHASDLDPPMLGAALPLRRLQSVYWAGDVGRLFRSAIGRAFARAARIFPVDEHSAAATLATARAVLRRDLGLVWFPESWRTPDGRLQKFLPGVGLLLAEEQVTVVPAYIHGTFQALPRQRRWPRFVKVTITFGTPIQAAEIRALAGQEGGPRRIVTLLQDRVAALQDMTAMPQA